MNPMTALCTRRIGGDAPQRPAPIVLIEVGEQLAVSGLLSIDDAYMPIGGHGGQVNLPACNAEEAALVGWCMRRFGHASAECFLSSRGLARLRDALADLRGQRAPPLPAAAIASRARAGDDALCSHAVDTFCAMLGTLAGDHALTLGAFGGVYLGGHLVSALGPLLERSPLRRRFEDKGRFAGYLARIPLFIVDAEGAP